MRFHIDGWDPAYGSAMEDTGEATAVAESTARIDATVETPPEQWTPVAPWSETDRAGRRGVRRRGPAH